MKEDLINLMELRSTPKLTEIHQCWYFFSNLLFSSCVVGSWVARWVSAAAARWVSGLGMRQLMAVWVLGLSRVGMGSGVMAWAAASRRDGSLSFSVSLSSLPFFSFLFFFFPSFLAFPFGFGVYCCAGFSSSFFFFYIYIYIKVFMGS